MKKNSFVIKGNICQTTNPKELDLHKNAYAVYADGISKGIFDILPEEYAGLPLYDYGDALIFPGMVDLHVHAPQYAFRGMCMDLELMEWLNQYTFPEEEKYEDLKYAEKALSDTQTTVGIALNIEHTSATPVGLDVRAEAEVTAVEGKVITFAVRAFDEIGEIGNGTHKRVIVNSQKFLDKAYSKL